ncbi:MAG: HAD family hydrolase [Gammaproteobacteria bacterium]|nr:HAD family hydrolase [Gammaproteobacteria bacterium]MDH3856516.1 HAD family hydrolase [Gammaproteobacteria bacterium]
MRVTPLRIAMWSGPRNISTALMRAWENRNDCVVWDEPLYGYYLQATGLPHPGAAEVIEAQGTDVDAIIERCTGAIPGGKQIFYQKHMTLHLLPEIERDWLSEMVNCFLIREPEAVITSYAAVRSDATLEDIGFIQQAELFDQVRAMTGEIPLVIDSREFLLDPATMLQAICTKLDIEFGPEMLSWPKGPRDSDGVWAKYWYDSVCNSTGFAPYREQKYTLSDKDKQIALHARPSYEILYQHRLRY